MIFKVRPFRTISDGPIQKVGGRIADGQYIFTLDFADYVIPVIEIKEDNIGSYALIKEGKIELGFDDTYIRIEASYDAGQDPGCEISFIRKSSSAKGIIDKALLDRGIHPNSVNVLAIDPPDLSFSVSFSSSGRFCGGGYLLTTATENKHSVH